MNDVALRALFWAYMVSMALLIFAMGDCTPKSAEPFAPGHSPIAPPSILHIGPYDAGNG